MAQSIDFTQKLSLDEKYKPKKKDPIDPTICSEGCNENSELRSIFLVLFLKNGICKKMSRPICSRK